MESFNQRKKDILLKLDKSSIGKWDFKIKSLCEKINSLDRFYTTSSCSGRIIVMRDEDKKGPGLFEFVSHDLVEFEEFMEFFNGLIFSLPTRDLARVIDSELFSLPRNRSPTLGKDALASRSRDFKNVIKSKSGFRDFDKDLNLKFKSEPPILHVVCKDLDSAEKLLDFARISGWKRSGIISLSKNIVVELISTEKQEFPLFGDGKILVGEEFLNFVLEKANFNLKKGWEKIEKLEKNLRGIS